MKICLDAGHYGKYNRSPVNSSYYESDMNWKLHLYLKSALEAYGVEVVPTRLTQEKDLPLEARGRKAVNCDLFLSLHSNACGDENTDYPLSCCCISGKADTLGQKLADTVHTIMQTRQTGRIWKRQGNSGDYYGVLRGAAKVGVPGILLEHSFHTNKHAADWLLKDANLKKLAQAEADTIAAYFDIKKEPSAFLVKITADKVGIHIAPDVRSNATGRITDKGVYTIVETAGNYGRLKSGAGWIYLKGNTVRL